MEPEENFNDILRELDKAINEADNPKNENYPNRTKTVYDYIAELAGLEHKKGNVYALKSTGQQFIRTKFGFQPDEVFNKGLQLSEALKKLKETQETLDSINLKYNDTLNALNILKSSYTNNLEETGKTKSELIRALSSKEEISKRLELYKDSINKLAAQNKKLLSENEILLSLKDKAINDLTSIKKESNDRSSTKDKLIKKLELYKISISNLASQNKELNSAVEHTSKKHEILLKNFIKLDQENKALKQLVDLSLIRKSKS